MAAALSSGAESDGNGGYDNAPVAQTSGGYLNQPTIGGSVNYGYQNPGTIGVGAPVQSIGAYFPNSTAGGGSSSGVSYGYTAATPPPSSTVGSGASKGAQ
jgi:hypothetical protein